MPFLKLKSENEKRRLAAAIAVSIALEENKHNNPSSFPLPRIAFVSAWQAVLRSNILTKRGHVR